MTVPDGLTEISSPHSTDQNTNNSKRTSPEEWPKISIVTPSFNQAQYLEECIDSILSQGYPNLEYVIMDGGSNDGSVEIIKKYEKHLAYWQSQPDGGQYIAVHEGFKKTSGDIMAWLNSDDKYHNDVFFKVAYLFDSNPGVEWLTGRPTFWDKDGELTHTEQVLPKYCRKVFLEGKYNQPFIQQESSFWQRSLWDRAGSCLSTNLEFAGDLELWIRFFRYALIYSVDTFLGGYRTHGNQKAILDMDRYVAEAERVILDEIKNYSEFDASMSLNPPSPLEIDLQGYKDYLSRHTQYICSPKCKVETEEVIQLLLKRGPADLTEKETRNKSWLTRLKTLILHTLGASKER